MLLHRATSPRNRPDWAFPFGTCAFGGGSSKLPLCLGASTWGLEQVVPGTSGRARSQQVGPAGLPTGAPALTQPCFSPALQSYHRGWRSSRQSSLYCISQILCLLLTNWRFVATLRWASLWAPFSKSICSLPVSVSHLVILTVFHTFVIITLLWWSVTSDLRWSSGLSPYYDCLKAQMMVNMV